MLTSVASASFVAPLGSAPSAVRALRSRPAPVAYTIHQCAWCRRLSRKGVPQGDPLPELIVEATHGICQECRGSFLADCGAADC